MDKAEQEFKTTIEIDDSYVNGYFNLGLLYQKKGDDAKTERYFKKTIEMDKTSEKAYLGLAFIYKKKGLVQDALRLYQELLNINPGNTTPMIEIGTIYFEMGKFSEAKEYFENVLKIDKDSTVAKSYLQRISEKNDLSKYTSSTTFNWYTISNHKNLHFDCLDILNNSDDSFCTWRSLIHNNLCNVFSAHFRIRSWLFQRHLFSVRCCLFGFCGIVIYGIYESLEDA